MVHGMHVRRSVVGSLTRRRRDLVSQTQDAEEEEPNPVRAFVRLRRLRFGLMTISHQNFASSVPCVPHTPAHAEKPNQRTGRRIRS
jgi:hypothetical protein